MNIKINISQNKKNKFRNNFLFTNNPIKKLKVIKTTVIIHDKTIPLPTGNPGGVPGYPSGLAKMIPNEDWNTEIKGADKGKHRAKIIRNNLVKLFILLILIFPKIKFLKSLNE